MRTAILNFCKSKDGFFGPFMRQGNISLKTEWPNLLLNNNSEPVRLMFYGRFALF